MHVCRFIKTLALTLTAAAGLAAASCGGSHDNDGLDSLYRKVDAEITRSGQYMAEKEKRIADLRREYAGETDDPRRLRTLDRLIEEYESYISDSALFYVSEAESVASRLGDTRERTRLQIKKADIASHAGLFAEAHQMLSEVPRPALDSTLLAKYYATYSGLYQYECEYLPDGEYSRRSQELRNIYTDSLMRVSSPESFDYLVNRAALEIGRGNNEEVRRLEADIRKHEPGTRQKKLQSRQRVLIYITIGLLLLVTGAVFYILKQIRRVQEANRRVSKSNSELQAMSARLQEMNSTLEKTNEELKLSNRVTEGYAGLFMEFSSINISALQKYHLALRNLAVQGNVKGILKKLDSGDVAIDTLKDFYAKFDEAILHIYPQFIEKVNQLMTDGNPIVLKGGEKLNTELRILALIRIGITDSEKISQFLRCSISTIYTYRSKLKKRAKNPDTFEAELMVI